MQFRLWLIARYNARLFNLQSIYQYIWYIINYIVVYRGGNNNFSLLITVYLIVYILIYKATKRVYFGDLQSVGNNCFFIFLFIPLTVMILFFQLEKILSLTNRSRVWHNSSFTQFPEEPSPIPGNISHQPVFFKFAMAMELGLE